ncbi:hypothetical protein [Nonomuraea sp. NPDC049480]|uniref:hypothetical protein n=1 Tax=Nonomuraea sp. NPDC049480 TaxID=3364353 RepID=UPI0037A7D615
MSTEELQSAVSSANSRLLEDCLAEWSLQSGIAVEVWALPNERLPSHIAEIVQSTVRDVLQDVERQARARTVSVALTVAPRGLRLTISEDGGGIAGEQLSTLTGQMSIRSAGLAALGGGLSINNVPGEGITVSAAVPRKALASESGDTSRS